MTYKVFSVYYIYDDFFHVKCDFFNDSIQWKSPGLYSNQGSFFILDYSLLKKISCIFQKKEYNYYTITYGSGIFIFYRLHQWQKKQIVHVTVETHALADLAAHVHTAKQKILKLALAISSSNYRLSLNS